MTLAKLKESFKDGAYRMFKVFQFGAKTAAECSPYGYDSNPNIEDLDAVFSETSARVESVILGFIQKNRFANKGETRLFSEDENGKTVSFVWLKNNGDLELNGKTDNLVKFNPLNNSTNNFSSEINSELVKIQAAITSLGGSYAMSNVSFDISESKADTLKTK